MAPIEPDIRIVPLERTDLDGLTSMRDDPQVVRFTRMPDPPPADFFQSWFARYEDGRIDGTREAFAIVDGERNVLGIALAPAIDRGTATVELGYVIHGHVRGRGLATRALELLTEWAFTELRSDWSSTSASRTTGRNGWRRRTGTCTKARCARCT
jgi:RimJ/RimL family protein N-acetyltransferase